MNALHDDRSPYRAGAPGRRAALKALLATPALLAAGCTGSLLPKPARSPRASRSMTDDRRRPSRPPAPR